MCHRCGEVGGATNQVSGVRFNEERNKQHETVQFILNSQIYPQRVPLRIHRCAGVEMYGFHGRRDRLCVTAASENSQEN